jgi:hypothetical protein
MIELTIESWLTLLEEELPLKPLKITLWRRRCQRLEGNFGQ